MQFPEVSNKNHILGNSPKSVAWLGLFWKVFFKEENTSTTFI